MIKNCFFLCFLVFFSPVFSQKNCKSDFKKITKIEKSIEKNEQKGFEDLLKLENSCSDYDFKIKIGELYYRYEKYEKLVIFYYDLDNYSIYNEKLVLEKVYINFFFQS